MTDYRITPKYTLTDDNYSLYHYEVVDEMEDGVLISYIENDDGKGFKPHSQVRVGVSALPALIECLQYIKAFADTADSTSPEAKIRKLEEENRALMNALDNAPPRPTMRHPLDMD